jgi:hypothetical protein
MSHIASFVTDDAIAAIHRYFAPGHRIAGSPHSPTRREPFAEQAVYKVVFVERPEGQQGQVREVFKCQSKAEALDLVADILPGAKEVTA